MMNTKQNIKQNTKHKGSWSNNIQNTRFESIGKNRDVTIDIDTDIDNPSFEGHLDGSHLNKIDDNKNVDDGNVNENISNETVNGSIEMVELNKNRDYVSDINGSGDENGENNEHKLPEKPTYTISKESMVEDFEKESDSITNKSIIYEYHFEKLNKIFNVMMVLNLIWNAVTFSLGSLSVSDIINGTNVSPYTIDICIIVLSFLGLITTGILTIFRYKDKIADISKYIGRLDTTKDIIDVLIKRIIYTGISDQEYYKQLEHSRGTLTHSNSSTYNINSKDYYAYYKRLKEIKKKKRDINNRVNLDKEIKFNEFSKRHLELLQERLKLKMQIKKVHDEAKNAGINDFDDSHVFTMDTISTHEE